MKAKPPKGKPGGSEPTPGATADDLPERWSVQRKMELVLRLLRGEALDAVSRESQVPAHEMERWQRIFLEQGKRGLRAKAAPAGTQAGRPRDPFSAKGIGKVPAGLVIGAARVVGSAGPRRRRPQASWPRGGWGRPIATPATTGRSSPTGRR